MTGPLPAVASVLKIIFTGSVDAQDIQNIIHWKYSGPPPTMVQVADVASQMGVQWAAELFPILPTTYDFDFVTVRDLSSDMGAEAVDGTSAGSGTLAGGMLPTSASLLAKYSTLRHWRGGHPRTYLPAGTVAELATNQDWSASFVTNGHTAWSAFINDFTPYTTPSGLTLTNQCAVSYRTGNAPRIVPVVDDLHFVEMATRVCTQRRRLGKAGG